MTFPARQKEMIFLDDLNRKQFYRPVDKRSRSAMTAFLEQHFRYDAANSWNAGTSYACNMKIHHLGLSGELVDKLFDMLDVPDFFDPIYDLQQEFAQTHNYLWQSGFNGRSGGYLVLYQGGRRLTRYKSYCTHCGQRNFTAVSETGDVCGRCRKPGRVDYEVPPMEVYAYPMRGVDHNEDFENWPLWQLRERVELVQDFDRLADAIVAAGVETAKKFEVREEIFFAPVRKKCLA